ncbi:hypothetical protein [Gordonia sp. (in: high G+C Gram-positive bacteria)]|uniref:hypothetical protein n=1 Tax=Gordonia sp. (in: high G+C Gram-positive bacteria) TaxID=84139 RepID=UPI003C729053
MSTTYDAGECRSCGQPVIWATTDKGKAMPINPGPDAQGNVALHRDKAGITAVVVPNIKAKAMRSAGQKLYLSHFGSCPHADRWRKDRK